jgi:uncharacterized LabA/DUF88 family protein
MDYKLKYLKYKKKYLAALNELRGGGLYEEGIQLLSRGENAEAVKKFEEANDYKSWIELILIYIQGRIGVNINYEKAKYYKDKFDEKYNFTNLYMVGAKCIIMYYGFLTTNDTEKYFNNHQSMILFDETVRTKGLYDNNKFFNHMMGLYYREIFQDYNLSYQFFILAHHDNNVLSTYELLTIGYDSEYSLLKTAAQRGLIEANFNYAETIKDTNIQEALEFYNSVSTTNHILAELSKIKFIFLGGQFTNPGDVKIGPNDRFIIDLSNFIDITDSTPTDMMNEMFNILKTKYPNIIGHASGSEEMLILNRLGFTQNIYKRTHGKEKAQVDLDIAHHIELFSIQVTNEKIFVFSGDGNDRLYGTSKLNPKSIYNCVENAVMQGKHVVVVSLYENRMSERYRELSRSYPLKCQQMTFINFLQNILESPFTKMKPYTQLSVFAHDFKPEDSSMQKTVNKKGKIISLIPSSKGGYKGKFRSGDGTINDFNSEKISMSRSIKENSSVIATFVNGNISNITKINLL